MGKYGTIRLILNQNNIIYTRYLGTKMTFKKAKLKQLTTCKRIYCSQNDDLNFIDGIDIRKPDLWEDETVGRIVLVVCCTVIGLILLALLNLVTSIFEVTKESFPVPLKIVDEVKVVTGLD